MLASFGASKLVLLISLSLHILLLRFLVLCWISLILWFACILLFAPVELYAHFICGVDGSCLSAKLNAKRKWWIWCSAICWIRLSLKSFSVEQSCCRYEPLGVKSIIWELTHSMSCIFGVRWRSILWILDSGYFYTFQYIGYKLSFSFNFCGWTEFLGSLLYFFLL